MGTKQSFTTSWSTPNSWNSTSALSSVPPPPLDLTCEEQNSVRGTTVQMERSVFCLTPVHGRWTLSIMWNCWFTETLWSWLLATRESTRTLPTGCTTSTTRVTFEVCERLSKNLARWLLKNRLDSKFRKFLYTTARSLVRRPSFFILSSTWELEKNAGRFLTWSGPKSPSTHRLYLIKTRITFERNQV